MSQLTVTLCCIFLLTTLIPSQCGVLKKKRAILEAEKSKEIGGRIHLTQKELFVNDLLLKLKTDEYQEYNEDMFLASKQFTMVKSKIDQSKLFNYIKKIPKGAAVHTHLFNANKMVDFLVAELKLREDFYVCDKHYKHFRFMEDDHNDTLCDWKNYKQLLQENPDFEKYLNSRFSMSRASEVKLNEVNKELLEILSERGMFRAYLKQVLFDYESDNIQHVQFRSDLFQLYEKGGILWNEFESFSIFNDILAETNSTVSVKFIYVPRKEGKYMKTIKTIFHDIYKTFPKLVLGIDFHNLDKNEQEHVKEFFAGRNLKYYSEGGKTNWFGREADTDIIDAFLSGSSRIGHAFSLQIHPELLKMVKENSVAIEICPISDQVHGLVTDFRNHPAVNYIANGLSVIIANDKPMFWGVSGLSYDWYVTFMAMTKNDAGLAFFKELAMNSIYHSGLDGSDKERLLRDFQGKWNDYVEEAHAIMEVLRRFG